MAGEVRFVIVVSKRDRAGEVRFVISKRDWPREFRFVIVLSKWDGARQLRFVVLVVVTKWDRPREVRIVVPVISKWDRPRQAATIVGTRIQDLFQLGNQLILTGIGGCGTPVNWHLGVIVHQRILICQHEVRPMRRGHIPSSISSVCCMPPVFPPPKKSTNTARF
jgi:hypothetical protein